MNSGALPIVPIDVSVHDFVTSRCNKVLKRAPELFTPRDVHPNITVRPPPQTIAHKHQQVLPGPA